MQASLRERLVAGDFDDVRVVVESLAGEFDLVQIAAAAIKIALQTDGRADEKDLPPVAIKPSFDRDRPGNAERPGGRERGAERDGKKPRKDRALGGDVVRLFIGAGRAAGVRPGDLVGAITGETGFDSGAVGSIEIGDRFSIVEVPKELEKEILIALRATKIRGRKVTVNRDRGHR
jgi:ATP-dependent RNA helicase DeaD